MLGDAPAPPPPSPSADAAAVVDAHHHPQSVDWSEAYGAQALDGPRLAALRLALQSNDEDAAQEAAFTLGRRAPVESFGSVLGVLPERLLREFARGAAGRTAEAQPAQMPTPFATMLTWPHPPLEVVSWAARAHATVPGFAAPMHRALLASDRLDDQIAGARLIHAPNVPIAIDLIGGLRPLPMALAFAAVAARGSTVPDAWSEWIRGVSVRLAASPRAWAQTWLALVSSAPLTDPGVRAAFLGTADVVLTVSTGEAAVDASFRCEAARHYDLLTGTTARIDACAADSHRWRSLVAKARFLVRRPNDPGAGVALLQLAREAQGDARVLEAVATASVALAPGLARPTLMLLAGSTDPGVLAALLDGLTLHVQHARTIPTSQRERMLRAPFQLDETAAVEARQSAIALARALAVTIPTAPSTLRAMQLATNPDASIAPQATVTTTASRGAILVLHTTAGEVRIALDGTHSPDAVALITEAAQAGRYNGTTFHRVVPGFVAQGGDPRGDGYGGMQRAVPTELSGERFVRGAVGVPLAGLDTGGMQLFVVSADAPHLDARYPWVGHVVSGMEVIDEMIEGDRIDRAEVVRGDETGDAR